MRFIVMFVAAVCFMFLIKLKCGPTNKNIYDVTYNTSYPLFIHFLFSLFEHFFSLMYKAFVCVILVNFKVSFCLLVKASNNVMCKWSAKVSNAKCGPPWSCLYNYDLFVNKVVTLRTPK